MIQSLFVALALAAAGPAMAQSHITPGMLSINDGAPVRVTSAAAVRRALRRCARPHGCASVMLETCDRCIVSAQAEGRGFMISERLGPPGTEFGLGDRRVPGERSHIFSAAEMIEIVAGDLSGRAPHYVIPVPAPEN